MTFLRLPSHANRANFPVNHPILSIPGVLLLLLASLGLCQSAAAQSIQPRPVARLVSEPASTAGYSRPRRVNPEESSAKDTPRAHAAAVETSPAPVAVPLTFDDATAIERRAFEQTNQARVENGLPPVEWDADLCRMARAQSERMAQLGYLSHETPEGLQLKDRARRNGILHFRVIGENIAYNKGYKDPGGFAVERWLISDGHRANILYVGFQAAAIGSYVAADGSVYLTQVFIAR
jgi:uncharacterized protein YkwD